MDEIIEAVNDSGINDGKRCNFSRKSKEKDVGFSFANHTISSYILAETEYAGSDDYLRAKFEEYILTLLSSVKHSQFTQVDDSIDSIGNATGNNNSTCDSEQKRSSVEYTNPDSNDCIQQTQIAI